MLPAINIVWFKRDLRLTDHAPLAEASRAGLPVLLLHFFEPSWLKNADSDPRHWRFVWQSIGEMQAILRQRRIPFWSFHCEILDFLDDLRSVANVKTIFSHLETGNALTFERDLSVARFCQQHGIDWQERPTAGVRRRLFHRKNWEQYFVETMQQPTAEPSWSDCTPFQLPQPFLEKWQHRAAIPNFLQQNNENMQPGGGSWAWRYLNTFLEERHRHYFKNISKPEAARQSCSRISPYLTWGNLSTRQVYQATQIALQRTGDSHNLGQFTSRLFWQSHFIQKFETECRMEFENLNRGFDSIRREVNDDWVAAWQSGKTGFPLVDACMRCVMATGYLNFRMRSMLVSFLTHHLWQPWQAGVHHLARQFLDYEPGIHFSQFQMQAGTMGVNTIRIYNPVKQSWEHDPDAVFIKKWLPELSKLPTPFAHEPWKMTPMEATMFQFRLGEDFPQRIVDVEKTHAHAREILWKWRQSPPVKAENIRILKVHTKRKDVEERTVMGDFVQKLPMTNDTP